MDGVWRLQDAPEGQLAEYERLRQCEQAAAPSLAEHLLALPQDDEPFERLPLVPREFPCS